MTDRVRRIMTDPSRLRKTCRLTDLRTHSLWVVPAVGEVTVVGPRTHTPRPTTDTSGTPGPYTGPELRWTQRIHDALAPVRHELDGIRRYVLRQIAAVIGTELDANPASSSGRIADRISRRLQPILREDIRDLGAWLLAVGLPHKGCGLDSCEDSRVWPTGEPCEICADNRRAERAQWARARELQARLDELRARASAGAGGRAGDPGPDARGGPCRGPSGRRTGADGRLPYLPCQPGPGVHHAARATPPHPAPGPTRRHPPDGPSRRERRGHLMPTTPHPTRGVTECDRCGGRIRWATVIGSGQRMPLNAMPSPMGGYAAHTTGSGGLLVRELSRDRAEPEYLEWKAVAHWSSCSGSGQQPRPPAPRSRPARRRPNVQPPLWGQPGGPRTSR
jgi:hypothetical protein